MSVWRRTGSHPTWTRHWDRAGGHATAFLSRRGRSYHLTLVFVPDDDDKTGPKAAWTYYQDADEEGLQMAERLVEVTVKVWGA